MSKLPGAQRVYIVGVVVLLAGYFTMPADTWWATGCFVAIGLVAAAAILAGVRQYRPTSRLPWFLFAAGIALNTLGTLVEAIASRLFHVEPFPGIPDIFYLALYPGLVIGLAVLIRRRTAQRDWAALVDSTTITTGLGLLSWVYVIRPAAEDPTIGLLGHAVSVAYPLGDVVVLAMLVRLLLGGGGRNLCFRLMAASLTVFLAGDATWAVINQLGLEPSGLAIKLLSMVFLLAYVLFGAAALHPSIREVSDTSVSEKRTPLSPRLLMMLTGASLVAPGVLALQVAAGRVTDGVAIVVGSVALFLLVVTRMSQLLRQLEAQAGQLTELARVDDLTGLPNRRAWSAELPRAIERARREERPLSVALIDLDYFKRFNDEFGHPAGDRLLKAAAAAWQGQLRTIDQLARYGGEEFIVLLPAADAGEAAAVLDRLRAVTPAGQTFSAGLATWQESETSDELVDRSDRALYVAKDTGRDRVVVAVDESVPAA